MTIYERIRMLRTDRGMSQDELARRCGYADRSMITKIEAGKVDLTISKVELLADVTKMRSANEMQTKKRGSRLARQRCQPPHHPKEDPHVCPVAE